MPDPLQAKKNGLNIGPIFKTVSNGLPEYNYRNMFQKIIPSVSQTPLSPMKTLQPQQMASSDYTTTSSVKKKYRPYWKNWQTDPTHN
ncbi:hypothetical protein QW060_20055 [Myroides ceti]|uniref:Uncharacterized protein n=2 Tax=Paenimyroides ceti TaxID=395087 RepID=A0ABT8D073_9FLAO|nr:hypothetical protein [Paenimyroides ceti]MDN3709313.1 hypothetical protein [Paenimyroides ceti]